MIGLSYLSFLLFSIAGMVAIDKHFKLAFFYAPRRTTFTLTAGTLVFTAWDALGIWLGIFLNGDSMLTTGIMLAPELPLEELFFLFFLCYFTLIIYRLSEVVWQRT